MNDEVLSALREIRALEAEDRAGFERRLLEIVAAATRSSRASLSMPPAGEDLHVVARDSLGPDPARLELRFPRRSGAAVLVLERSSPFGAKDNVLAELAGGEIVLRLDQDRAEREGTRVARQIELLHKLSRAAADAQRLPEVADRAAVELLRAFEGSHVLVHVMVEEHLELVARRVESRSSMDSAPEWIRRIPLEADSVMAAAARTKTITSRLVADLPPARRAVLEPQGVRHLLVAPLVFHDTVFGTITVAHRSDLPWNIESLRFLEDAATQLAVELAHVRLLEAERRRTEDLGLINELGTLVAQHIDLPSVLSTAVNELARILRVEWVHLFLADDARSVLVGAAHTGRLEANVTFPLTENAAVVHAFRTLQPVLIEDTTTDHRASQELVVRYRARSIMAVPLISRGEAIGAIALIVLNEPRTFTATEVARTVAVANLVSPAVANAKMFDDLRRSYEALARTQAELVTHERLAALGELSAVIAHEVRNPLAIIFNSLGALRRLEPADTEANLLLDIVGEEAARLNRIVGDLLDFVRPYSSHPRRVQIDAIVRGAVEAARRAAPEVNVEVRTDVRVPCNDVYLDGTMLQQALLNLIVNAVQATPRGRTVTVRATVPTIGGESPLQLEVIDEGPGVDVADSARVFQPFFTTKATGTGLGLALVRRIADTVGGVVEVSRAPAGGAIFTLRVPLVPMPRDLDAGI